MKRARFALFALLALASAGCPKSRDSAPGTGATATNAPPALPDGGAGASSVAMDLLARFDDCTLGHHGPLLDLGDPTSRAAYGVKPRGGPQEAIERDGATWARVTSRALSLSFVADGVDAYADAAVSARIRGGSAKSVSVYVNDKPIGMWRLAKDEITVVETPAEMGALNPGMNELTLRFNGAGRASSETLAEIDWIHVGAPKFDEAYAAPTRTSALVSATIANVPKRAFSLRAPGFARCSGAIPSGGVLEAKVALAGATDGEVEVKLLRDRKPPTVLATFRLAAADANAWKPIRVPLGDLGENAPLGAIELVAKSVTKGGRVLFAEPRILASGSAAAPARVMPPSRGVVLVVLGDVSPRGLALYGGTRALPELGALASSGVTFDAARATTTVPSGAVASMLTGLEAPAHGVNDHDRKLPPTLTTIADAARQGGVAAAMFTANPLTRSAFGFDRAWETYEMRSPTEEGGATAIFDRAAQWIEAHKSERFLVVIHARGGHPPWDVAPDQLKTLTPAQYTGSIDPKHAAELLAKARRQPPVLRYTEQDRERTWALYDVALAAHDAALGRFVGALEAAGRGKDTAIFVTADVAVDEAARVPFGDGETLDEAELRVPLVVRPASEPGGASFAGKHVATPTSGVDVARSMLDALGLAPPSSFGGVDLWETASREEASPRPLLAVLDERFSLRWGSFVLAGGREPRLCNLALEPVCTTDVRATHPLAADAIQREAVDILARLPVKAPREVPTIDGPTAAALKAWGR